MYKIIIADDEEVIRQGLSSLFANDELGFRVMGAFKDGKDVIEYINNNEVDVVLTDIRMIKVSGIELAKYIYDNMPHIKVVIISGYKDFDYAKKAIEYNVEHYLLKPTDFDEFSKVFSRIKQILDKEAVQGKQLEQYEEIIPILRESFFTDLVMGALRDKDEIMSRLDVLGLEYDINKNYCYIINLLVDDYEKYLAEKWEYGKEKLNVAINNFIRQQNSQLKIYQIYQKNNTIKLFCISKEFASLDEVTQKVNELLEKVTRHVQIVLGLKINLKIESSFNNLLEVPNKCRLSVLEITDTLNGSNSIKNSNDQILHEKNKLLLSHINSGNHKEAECMIDSFIDEISDLPIQHVHGWVINMITLIFDKFEKVEEYFSKINSQDTDYRQIVQMNDIEDIRIWLKRLICNIIEKVSEDSSTNSETIIYKAKKYIDINYSNDISLQDIADQVYLNPVYFCRFFKQHTGENFSDYLIRVRMNHAVELLKMGLTVEEISIRTGYRSSRYFTKLFKQYTGYTTKEYLRRITKEGKN